MRERVTVSEPVRARRSLWSGVLVFRLIAFVWFLVLNLLAGVPARNPAFAYAGLGAAAAWTAYLMISRVQERAWALWLDLVISMTLIVISGLVVPEGRVTGGSRLFFATAYPISTSLAWGAARGRGAGVFATGALALALVGSRLVNGIPLSSLDGSAIASLANGMVTYLLAGVAAGVVSRLLDRWEAQNSAMLERTMRDLQSAAALAERQSLARTIHDATLQNLARALRSLRELSGRHGAEIQDIRTILRDVEDAEQELREVFIRDQRQAPAGKASLSSSLKETSRAVSGLPVTVICVGPIWLADATVGELTWATRQALENVIEHAEATRAAVFADVEDGTLEISIHDDGHGFTYRDDLFQGSEDHFGLQGMRGRIERLGGRMKVRTAPGAGTEVEFRVTVGEDSPNGDGEAGTG
jgi:signal transduction histidine kinase